MSDTPETDAAVIAAGGDWSFVLRETCRRLERERDEAREAFVIATDQMVQAQSVLREVRRDLAEAQIGCLERARLLGIGGSMEAKVISERDELREKYDNLATKHMLAINKICNERDEAREKLSQLEKKMPGAN